MILVVLAGPPCSGKTTYIEKYHKNDKIVSSDDEIDLLLGDNFSQNELNILGVKNSLKKIFSYINKGEKKVVYDSTNLTVFRRQKIFESGKEIEIRIEAINFISDFNNIYLNWEKRGKDLKIEMLLYLFMIFEVSKPLEGFNAISNIENIQKNNFKYLKSFLEGKKFDKKNILEENKDLKVLDQFWQKGGKIFFDEYSIKLDFLENMTLDDKLALFYSDVKYFYNDFINSIDITYSVSYNDFIEGFINNVLIYKIKGLKLDKDKVIKSFYKLIEIF